MPPIDWTVCKDREQDFGSGRSHWVFAGPRRPIIAVGIDSLADHLRQFLADWPHERVATAPPPAPDIVVRVEGSAHTMFCRGLPDETYLCTDPFHVTQTVVGALIYTYLSQVDDGVLIHAAAVELGDGVALLVGGGQAGKSSLGLHLAAAGHRLYGDDGVIHCLARWPRPATATCLGVNPKVRLPLPDNCGVGYRRFVETRAVFRNEVLAILRLEEERAACFGEEREIAALIALDRRDSGEAVLAPVAPSAMLRKVLECGFSICLTVDALLTGLSELARKVPGYVLRYSSSAEAAALVEKELCAG